MSKHNFRQILLNLFAFLLVCLATYLLIPGAIRKNKSSLSPQEMPKKLPDDVEMVMERYAFRNTQGPLTYEMSGDRLIYRGRQMLGLRSNIVKATFFENIRGKILSKKGVVEFSASDAEWNTSSTSPLLLQKNVRISVNEKRLDDIQRARIYFAKGVLEVSGKRKETFRLM